MTSEALPDWNDLPQGLRSALVKEREFYDQDFGGDCAVAIYNVLKAGLPKPEPEVFPLFAASLSTPEPVNVDDTAVEAEIDRLRLAAFKSNSLSDRDKYFAAASKWFQDRHYRRMNAAPPAPVSAPSVGVESDLDTLVGECWTELCERDDRTSPPDTPDMCLITMEELAQFMGVAATSALTPSPKGVDAVEVKSGLIDYLRSELSGAYDCTRVWSAWSYGTMSEDDFTPLDDRIEDIASSILSHLGIPDTSTEGKS